MAVVHYSALVTAIKGRTRGAIFQSGPGGQIVRSAGNFNRTAGGRWQALKHQTGVIANTWAALTRDEQQAWNSMSANTPSKNRFGEKRLTSGYNLFMKANKILLANNANLITVPPQQMQLTNWPGFVWSLPIYNIMMIFLVVPVQSWELVIIEMTAPVRAGRRLPPGGFKKIAAFNPIIPTLENITTDYNAVFGQAIPNMEVMGKSYIVNTLTGQKSVPVINRIFILP